MGYSKESGLYPKGSRTPLKSLAFGKDPLASCGERTGEGDPGCRMYLEIR